MQSQRRQSIRFVSWLALVWVLLILPPVCVFSQGKFEDRRIGKVDIVLEGSTDGASTAEQYRLIAKDSLGDKYSAVKVRDSLDALHRTGKIVSVEVQAVENGSEGVDLKYLVKRKTQAQKVSLQIGKMVGDPITEQELLFKLNLLNPGTPISEQILQNNADLILEYLRDRGYFNAEVTFTQQPLQSENEVAVTFRVTPNTQAKVETFDINIDGIDAAKLAKGLKLMPGDFFSRTQLTADVEKIRSNLRDNNFLAPELEEPRVVFDGEKNAINITLDGKVGPAVTVTVKTEKEKIGEKTQLKLLPVKRDGTLDYAAIVEGERRLENYYQEQGYFFADVTPRCSVDPPFLEGEASSINNNTEFLCSALGSAELANRKVELVYDVSLNRKLRLIDIRLKGTGELTAEDISSVLESQEANILGIIPLFGYGRGFTSQKLLDEDAATIKALMRELGYRDADVRVNQGVSPNGEDLIITFQVEEGIPSVISDIDVTGNKEIPGDMLLGQLSGLVGKNYSRAKLKNAERKLSEFYAEKGYFDARINSSIVPSGENPNTKQKLVKIVFKVDNEGRKVIINRVLVTGNRDTRSEAILKALNLKPNKLLRRTDIYTSEQNLYSSDAFGRVEIKPEPAGDGPDGSRLSDVIVNVDEQPPRLMQYGGGFSTDLGANGFFDIRHFNLFGRLWQGGARIRWSQRQQLVQFDYINPRFLRDGKNKFAPLTLTAQYQRDSTVTRFFRSAFDKGTFGIVQRLDANNNPIDEFGNAAGSPTLNRLTLTAETNRTINRKRRSVLFVRYRFEDVRLFNIDSLLIKDLLLPDSRIRISGLGATFVRDTRENCSLKYSVLELIAKGEPGDRCRYNAGDPTRGDYLTADYSFSAPVLGANIGFNKIQLSYNYYYTFPQLKNTTFAGRAILGLASVFAKGNRFSSAQFPNLEGILPISERFFAGGSNTLRGFDFEEAGPRVVVVPQGTFRNSNGESVFLDPFTIPFGGNALAVVNLEARVPLTKSVRAVPFYDGGNVFRRVGDIFNPPDVPQNDVFRQNLRALWSHTVGLGLRLKTPVGGEFGIDYGYLLNPPRFLIPQVSAPNATYQLRQSQIHFRFSQAF